MYTTVRIYLILLAFSRGLSAAMGNRGSSSSVLKEPPKPQVTFTEEELRQRLTEEEFKVTQEKGTERAWTGKYLNVKKDGSFNCVVCGTEVFKTDKKFESGSGWPSFSDVAQKGNVVRILDESHGMTRTEVACGKCGAHLGHVFDDGPKKDTGLRYCVNSVSLKFEPKDKGSSEERKEDAAEEEETEATASSTDQSPSTDQ